MADTRKNKIRHLSARLVPTNTLQEASRDPALRGACFKGDSEEAGGSTGAAAMRLCRTYVLFGIPAENLISELLLLLRHGVIQIPERRD